MSITIRALLVLAAASAAALAIRAVSGRFLRLDRVAESQTAADMTMEAIAALYGVLVAFILAGAWTRIDEARAKMMLEATAFAELRQIARILPLPLRGEFGSAVEAYRMSTLAELPLLAEGRSSPETDAVLDRLWRILAGFRPETPGDAELQSRAFDAVVELGNQRRIRLHADSRPLPTILWLILLGGAVAVLWLVAVSSFGSRLSVLYLVLLSAVVGLSLYAIYALSYPARSGLVAEMAPILYDLLEQPSGHR